MCSKANWPIWSQHKCTFVWIGIFACCVVSGGTEQNTVPIHGAKNENKAIYNGRFLDPTDLMVKQK